LDGGKHPSVDGSRLPPEIAGLICSHKERQKLQSSLRMGAVEEKLGKIENDGNI
jgi:hypothetical protein